MTTMLRRRAALQLVLLLTVGAMIALCLAALACGPAAPAGHGGTLETAVAPTITPTATLPIAPTDGIPWDGSGPLPPTPTFTQMQWQYYNKYSNIDGNLFRAIEKHEAAMAAAGSPGASGSSNRPAPTPNIISLIVTIDAPENVAGVQRVLADNGAANIWCGPITISDRIRGGCAADAPVSLLRRLAEQSGVLRIDPERTRTPASQLWLPAFQQSVADAHSVPARR